VESTLLLFDSSWEDYLMGDETVPNFTTFIPAGSLTNKQPKLEAENYPVVSNDDKVRKFLAIWTAFLMLVVLVGYLITRDAGVLVDTTIIGIAVTFVFGYYFKRKGD
jgi:hypothetical protein